MPKPRTSLFGVTLRFLRFASGWSEEELARALGIQPALISGYERGSKQLSRERLEKLLAVMGILPEAIDASLYALELARPSIVPGSPVDPTPAQLRKLDQAAVVAGQKAASATRGKLVENLRRARASRDRRRAGELWKTLQELPPKQRRQAIETKRKYWIWALAERLCAESVRAAAHRADGAVELAGLALRVAELAPGSEAWQSRLLGYVWAFVGNARRVQGDLPGSEEAFLRSDRLWEAGAAGDPGVLDTSRLLDLKASLRRYQGRFEEAIRLLDQAVQMGGANGRILVKKANTLELMGEYERALIELRQAEPLVKATQEPRLLWMIRFALTVNLWQLALYGEAAAMLPEVRELAVELGNELDLVRLLWLEGRIATGLGQWERAIPALEQVRRYFTINQIAYDAALASLEVAVLLLERERTKEVKRLAEEMLWIFKDQGVHTEALAALRLFYEAARKEEASTELARRVVRYLLKARDNPGLRFEM